MTDETSFLASLFAIVGEKNVISMASDMAAYLIDVRRTYEGSAMCVVFPASTEEVSRIVKLCAQNGVPITPMGGNTGLVGGATARTETPGIILNLRKMNRIRDLSTLDDTITVDAGCVLQDLQQAAVDADRFFPLSLSAEGSCQIGGNIATNAGGLTAIRYGVTRNLVLGLEVVLPSGEILSNLVKLRKDNTGYDLRQLFIGSEGTLGIITGAVLKLFPPHRSVVTSMLAVESVENALAVLGVMRDAFGERVTSFELTGSDYMDVILRNVEGTRLPFEQKAAWYVLLEICDSAAGVDLSGALETALGDAFENGLVSDAVISQNQAQTNLFWHLRHGVSDGIRYAGPNMSHDSSVPIDKQGPFAEKTKKAIKARFPESEVLFVAHLGDGNMHLVVLFKPDRFANRDEYMAAAGELDIIIDDVVMELQGSITAEHGIGLSYRYRLKRTTDPVELQLMRGIKKVFDPQNIMNPGKILLDA
ncbi:FAD-binding oxidoreductase [Ochrobactrum soli]|uniref:FAD-binding oxidoreductase n=1 Tax=Ochrobactrum soli TaxID=2448455 RepID=A0A849KXN6_9HYPH|nr:FAD-binding oxidoreductase [[Ochrobactrum] soli]NNU63478.1 FAD-binding oxidoreductase [[Ochrobactrum] soli]